MIGSIIDNNHFANPMVSYNKDRIKEIKLIKELLKEGYEPVFYSKNNWFMINNITFNGYTKEDVENIRKELKL